MKRRAFLFASLFRPPANMREFQERVLAFEEPYDVFIRKLFGCLPGAEMKPENCAVWRQEIDRKAFEQARKAAKKLFEFEEKC